MKKISLVILFAILSLQGFMQDATNLATKPLSLSVSTSAFAGKGIGNIPYFSTSVMPMLSYIPGGKWKIITGIKAETSSFSLPTTISVLSENTAQKQQYQLNRYTYMVGANYQWSDRFSVSGIFRYSQNQWKVKPNDAFGQNLPAYSYSAIVGFDYKVTENIRIEGSFHYQKNDLFNPYACGFGEQYLPYNVFSHN